MSISGIGNTVIGGSGSVSGIGNTIIGGNPGTVTGSGNQIIPASGAVTQPAVATCTPSAQPAAFSGRSDFDRDEGFAPLQQSVAAQQAPLLLGRAPHGKHHRHHKGQRPNLLRSFFQSASPAPVCGSAPVATQVAAPMCAPAPVAAPMCAPAPVAPAPVCSSSAPTATPVSVGGSAAPIIANGAYSGPATGGPIIANGAVNLV